MRRYDSIAYAHLKRDEEKGHSAGDIQMTYNGFHSLLIVLWIFYVYWISKILPSTGLVLLWLSIVKTIELTNNFQKVWNEFEGVSEKFT